ncbi:hypothetical protein MDS_3174 [Ectopseudomonas mendocina NK-01]|nr:hypothetical protein MDS_3174 [Pseudomonas mendocina NK-01]
MPLNEKLSFIWCNCSYDGVWASRCNKACAIEPAHFMYPSRLGFKKLDKAEKFQFIAHGC